MIKKKRRSPALAVQKGKNFKADHAVRGKRTCQKGKKPQEKPAPTDSIPRWMGEKPRMTVPRNQRDKELAGRVEEERGEKD